jgi:hypothetical protein
LATATNAPAPTLIVSLQRAMRLLETVSSHPDGAPAKQLAREALAHWRDAIGVPVYFAAVSDRRALLERLASTERMQSVVERQEYALRTVCAAIPITAGSGAAAMGISLPLHQEERLLPAVEQLRNAIGGLLDSIAFSISI